MSTIPAHLKRIHDRCLDIIADEVQNCASLAEAYGMEVGNIHPAPAREIHVQSVLFAGLRASGYFTLAGSIYDMPANKRRQIDLAIWLPDVRKWFYLEVKPCEQQGGSSNVIADAEKLKNDKPADPRDQLRGVLAYGFKYRTRALDRYPAKFEKIGEALEPMEFRQFGPGHRDLNGGNYRYVQVGMWVIGLDPDAGRSRRATGNARTRRGALPRR
jgi:hypothetical protein